MWTLPGGKIISKVKGSSVICLLAIVILAVLLATSSAKIGYSINVRVNGSDWGWSQSTNMLSLKMESIVNGDGNFSKWTSVDGFAGNGLKENTHAGEGKVYSEDSLNVVSIEKYIHITEKVNEESNRYIAEINESLPTVVHYKSNIYYKGNGIFSRKKYVTEFNTISTDYYANLLTQSSNYAGVYSNSIIRADITSDYRDVREMSNRSMAFMLSSTSDRYSGFSYTSDNQRMEERYMGLYKINKNMYYRSSFNLVKGEDQVGCCLDDRTLDENLSLLGE
ncbi:MAG: hypothetical protein HPY61_11135 [Methanotrichaceae archaeon]|nr:hypothetical protein [Methanotrichaceae archaeon]